MVYQVYESEIILNLVIALLPGLEEVVVFYFFFDHKSSKKLLCINEYIIILKQYKILLVY